MDIKFMLRFEAALFVNGKQRNVWLDIGKNTDVCVPNIDGKIRIKALRLPKNVAPKVVIPFAASKPDPSNA